MMDIRDISADLKARLELIAQRRRAEEDRHELALQAFDREEEMVKGMIELESRLLANNSAKALAAKPLRPGAANSFESEILDILSNNKDWEHSEVKAELLARGIGSANDPNFGRSLQGALLSMRARALVDLTGLRQWHITEKGLGPEHMKRRVV